MFTQRVVYELKRNISIIKVAIKNSYVYKMKLFFYSLMGIMQFLIYWFLWKAIISGGKTINGFNQEHIMTYFVLSFIIQSMLPRWITMEIGWKNKRGDIAIDLLRPINFQRYLLFYSIGDVIYTMGFMGLPILILGIFSKTLIYSDNFIYFFLSLINSYLISFYMFYIVGLLSFWVTNIWGVFISFEVIYLFFSGALIPITFLPDYLITISSFLPFKSLVETPIMIYLGLADSTFISILIQLVWLVVLKGISVIMFNKARKRTEIFGG